MGDPTHESKSCEVCKRRRFDVALREIRRELYRQVEKHGDQACSSPTVSRETKLVILVEEVGEVARAMTYDEGSTAKLREELLQVAAVAVGFASSL